MRIVQFSAIAPNALRDAFKHTKDDDTNHHKDFSRANCHRYVLIKLARQLGEASFLSQQIDLTIAFARGPYG